ncbi:hypothetical protein [Streptomyces sp. NPDC088733]|uniref:hypothetical protein n=1 Tax=Streptomyces sp. NPDC088733 TaxID=3365880 RepID=UPI0038144CEB
MESFGSAVGAFLYGGPVLAALVLAFVALVIPRWRRHVVAEIEREEARAARELSEVGPQPTTADNAGTADVD